MSMLEKILVSFGWSNNPGATDVRMHGFVPEEKPSFKMLELSLSSVLDYVFLHSLYC